jgi:hypothetical protein
MGTSPDHAFRPSCTVSSSSSRGPQRTTPRRSTWSPLVPIVRWHRRMARTRSNRSWTGGGRSCTSATTRGCSRVPVEISLCRYRRFKTGRQLCRPERCSMASSSQEASGSQLLPRRAASVRTSRTPRETVTLAVFDVLKGRRSTRHELHFRRRRALLDDLELFGPHWCVVPWWATRRRTCAARRVLGA